MNIFVIPSWFPSTDNPVSGIIIKEQTEAFCRFYPSVNVGVSIWGQQEEAYLLWSRDHLKNIKKLAAAGTNPYTISLLPNMTVYHSPTFTWSRKLLNGNMRGVIKANINNFKAFEAEHGKVDIIHAHVGFPAGLIAMELARKTKKPFILTEHMGPFPWAHTTNRKGFLTPYYKEPYRKAAINIAVSPFQEQVMSQQRITNVVVIPNFADERFFAPAVEKPPASKDFTFFSLSYIAPNKGTDVLIYAAKELLREYKNVKFRIGGDGPFLGTCKALAIDLGISDKIVWLGDLSRKEALLEFQNCDAFTLASNYESMGVVFVEAIACGKPIVATRCGGPEATVVASNGLLVEKNNPYELAQAMQSIIDNRNKYNSKVIRQDFLERFSAEAVVPRLYSLYKQVAQDTVS